MGSQLVAIVEELQVTHPVRPPAEQRVQVLPSKKYPDLQLKATVLEEQVIKAVLASLHFRHLPALEAEPR